MLFESCEECLWVLLNQFGRIGMGRYKLFQPRVRVEKLLIVKQARILFHLLLNLFNLGDGSLSDQQSPLLWAHRWGRWARKALRENCPTDGEQ